MYIKEIEGKKKIFEKLLRLICIHFLHFWNNPFLGPNYRKPWPLYLGQRLAVKALDSAPAFVTVSLVAPSQEHTSTHSVSGWNGVKTQTNMKTCLLQSSDLSGIYPRHPGFSVLLLPLISVGARQSQRIWFLKFFLSGHIWCIFRGFCPYLFTCFSLKNMTQNFLTRSWDHIDQSVISQMRKWRQGEIAKPVVVEPEQPARLPSLIHVGSLKGAHVLSYWWS